MKRLEKQAALLDVCLPDYFSGYFRPVIAVPLHDKISNKEVAEEMKDEINAVYDYLTNEDNGYSEEEMALFDAIIDKLAANPDMVFFDAEDEAEDEDEDIDSVFAYFAIIHPVVQNGIMFLNE